VTPPLDPNVALVSSWSLDWRGALPSRTPEELGRLRDEVRRAVAALQAAERAVEGRAGRALHRRGLYLDTHATFEVSPDIPEAIGLGPFTPGSVWPAAIRLSSAYPLSRPDSVPDQRGLAVRLADGARRLDLLATTSAAHHARDARAMIASLDAATAAVSEAWTGKARAFVTLVKALGVIDTLRMARTVSRAAQADVSLAALTYHSRAPFQLGPYAVRHRFAPMTPGDATLRADGDDALTGDLAERLRVGEVSWSFELQGFLDRERTPMDDHRIPWRSPWLTVARLTLVRQEPVASKDDRIAFLATPDWPDPRGAVLEPLGDLNALRGAAYAESAHGRGAT
jgi:hypothetical protein